MGNRGVAAFSKTLLSVIGQWKLYNRTHESPYDVGSRGAIHRGDKSLFVTNKMGIGLKVYDVHANVIGETHLTYTTFSHLIWETNTKCVQQRMYSISGGLLG